MGTSLARHHQASLKAPIKAALLVAENALLTLIRDGPIAYADDLEREAQVSPDPMKKDVLRAIAEAVRSTEGLA